MDHFLLRLKYNFIIPIVLWTQDKFVRKKFDKSPNRPPLFFILGSGRNGSTLLAKLLNRHSQILLPPEQYALPFNIVRRSVKAKTPWNYFVKNLLADFKSKNQNWLMAGDDYDFLETSLGELPRQRQNVANAYSQILKRYSHIMNKDALVFGDHTPNNSLYYRYILREFGNEKFIFLLRHPYDVILSYSKIKDNPASDPAYAAWKWNNAIKAYATLRKDEPAKVLLVKYEDLVRAPKDTLDRIFTFLDVGDEQVLNKPDFIENPMGVEQYNYHKKLTEPINSRYIGNWQGELDKKITRKIRSKISANAKKFGYSLDSEGSA